MIQHNTATLQIIGGNVFGSSGMSVSLVLAPICKIANNS
jgi:hypothetical protein